MSETIADFQPSPDVIEIIMALREDDLAWIAEEIEGAIRSGRVIEENLNHPSPQGSDAVQEILRFSPEYNVGSPKSRQRRGDQTVQIILPYTSLEQLEITLRVIRNYTIGLYATWEFAQSQLADILDDPSVRISIANLGSDQSVDLFRDDFQPVFENIERLLKRAWPGQYPGISE